MIQSREFEYFMAVVQEGSISKAAEKLFITQPSMSKFLRRLENDLGVKLLERGSIPVRLTPAGEKYLDYIQQAVALQDIFLDNIRQSTEEKIVLGVTPWRGSFILPGILSSFRASYPNVDIKVVEEMGATLSELLYRGKLDIAITAYPCEDERFRATEICQEQLLILAPRSYGLVPEALQRHNTPWNPFPIDMHRLRGRSIITTKPGQKLYHDLQAITEKFQLTPANVAETSNMNSLLRLADSDFGITIIPELYIKKGPALHNVHYLCCEDPLFEWRLSAIYRADNSSPVRNYLVRTIKHNVEEADRSARRPVLQGV